jgi:hypothetical protein
VTSNVGRRGVVGRSPRSCSNRSNTTASHGDRNLFKANCMHSERWGPNPKTPTASRHNYLASIAGLARASRRFLWLAERDAG